MKFVRSFLSPLLFKVCSQERACRFLAKLERAAARELGKGYKAPSVGYEVAMAKRLLNREAGLAVDIGGNVGHYTAELRLAGAGTEIHVFEPSAVNVEKLTARFQGDALVTIVPCAVSDQAGDATLFSDAPGSGLGSLNKRRLDLFHRSFDVTESVRTIRFEDYWRSSLGCRSIDLVKIDVEGHELSVLQGFGDALKAVHVMQFEFGGCNIDSRTFFRDFWYFFKEAGFDLYRITPHGNQRISDYRESDEFFSFTNFLAKNTVA